MVFTRLLILLLALSCSSHVVRTPASSPLVESEGVIDGRPYWMLKPEGEFFVPLPVVYFLHGRGGNRHMFRDLGGIKAMKDYLHNGGTPFVVVALTGTFEGKDSYWINETRDHIIRKMIPEIEDTHSIGGPGNRMVAGISMGSHGAYQFALTSKLFKCVAGHSLVLRNYESMNGQFPGLFGTKRQFERRDPISLIKKIKLPRKVPFKKAWVDIGGKDVPEFIDRARLMEAELLRLGFDSQSLDVTKTRPDGAHDYPYWSSRMPEYLQWYGKCFL